jgi:hypothetical protein
MMKLFELLTKQRSLRFQQRRQPDPELSDNILSASVMAFWAGMLDEQLVVTQVLVGSFGLAGYKVSYMRCRNRKFWHDVNGQSCERVDALAVTLWHRRCIGCRRAGVSTDRASDGTCSITRFPSPRVFYSD